MFIFVFYYSRIRDALWFVMEPLMSKNENFSFGFYKGLVEKVKNKIDAIDEEVYNEVIFWGGVFDREFCYRGSKANFFQLPISIFFMLPFFG